MKTKIGTALDRDLLRRVRSVAAREGKRLNEVIEAALAEHLARRSLPKSNVVARTAGSLRLSREQVDRIPREEPGILDDIG
jgi:hypothetical protein